MYRFNWNNWQSDPDYLTKAPDLLESAVEKGAHGVKIWKDLGLTVKDPEGNLVTIDDERFSPIWERAQQIGCIVAFHTVDPVAFFEPWNEENERWEELELHPDWSFADRSIYPARAEVLTQRNNVIRAFPNLKFQCVHGSNWSEDFSKVDQWLDEMPNMFVDTSAEDNHFYETHWRYLQTKDEQFDHPTPIQGNWKIDGIGLTKKTLKKIYWDNAYKLYKLEQFGVS